jgi:molybdopterin converting factor small subunit
MNRGKRIDNGRWVFGSYFRDEENNKSYIITEIISKCIDKYAEWEGELPSCCVVVEVIPETVGWCTELKDNTNGKIFTGDLYYDTDITDDYDYHYDVLMVSWDKRFLQYVISSVFSDYSEPLADIDVGLLKYAGNIHDNPELLEER